MQLNPSPQGLAVPSRSTAITPTALRLALGAATSALLASAVQAQSVPPPAATTSNSKAPAAAQWQADAWVLQYSEADGRVKATEPVVALRRQDGDDRITSLRLILDSLTGASPTGAVPQPGVQTVTSPSGGSEVVIAAGSVPMDHHFKDQRQAASLSHEQGWGANRRIRLGLNASGETDFASLGAEASLAQDFDERHTTLSVGWAGEADYIKPVGQVQAGLQPRDAAHIVGRSRNRGVNDLLLGWSQILGRGWLMRLNLGLGTGSGYHSDPYKVLSVIDPVSGLQTGDGQVAEARPRSRRRSTLYWQQKLHTGSGVLDTGLRAYRDSWGVRATTLEAAWRHELGRQWWIEPQLRLYRQTAADFYKPYLVEGVDWFSAVQAPAMAAASADARLGAFSARTLGLAAGLDLGSGRSLTARVSVYAQRQKEPGGAPGYLSGVRLTQDLKASTFLLGYTQAF
ncbi:MAG: hypothetical protein RL722_2457 [Pseudomonadota bacterium]|jgi:hypothetical protein